MWLDENMLMSDSTMNMNCFLAHDEDNVTVIQLEVYLPLVFYTIHVGVSKITLLSSISYIVNEESIHMSVANNYNYAAWCSFRAKYAP